MSGMRLADAKRKVAASLCMLGRYADAPPYAQDALFYYSRGRVEFSVFELEGRLHAGLVLVRISACFAWGQ